MKYLDKEEKRINQIYKKGEWKSIKRKDKKKYEQAAKESLAKNKRINIRLTNKDYNDIQVKAIEEGIPYQTLQLLVLFINTIRVNCVPQSDN